MSRLTKEIETFEMNIRTQKDRTPTDNHILKLAYLLHELSRRVDKLEEQAEK
mgnify:CR=1 FL=1